jgi:glutathione S-transferase
VTIFLAEKELDVPLQEVGHGFGLSAEYLRFNPEGVVPMLLLDDGTRVFEAMAICRFFEVSRPEPPLFGRSPREAALIDMWERRAYEGAMIGTSEVFRNSHPAFESRGLAVGREPVAQIPDLVERGKGRLRRFADSVDQQLSRSRFAAGDEFSVADITALCGLDFAAVLGLNMLESRPNLARWHVDVSQRPSARLQW